MLDADLMGSAIRDARKAQKLTQTDLAKAAGLSTNFICLLERGKRRPTLGTLENLGRALKIPCIYFLIASWSDYNLLAHQDKVVKGAATQTLTSMNEAFRFLNRGSK